jgi:hypothetical protein
VLVVPIDSSTNINDNHSYLFLCNWSIPCDSSSVVVVVDCVDVVVVVDCVDVDVVGPSKRLHTYTQNMTITNH